jgi:hypothetical protein
MKHGMLAFALFVAGLFLFVVQPVVAQSVSQCIADCRKGGNAGISMCIENCQKKK